MMSIEEMEQKDEERHSSEKKVEFEKKPIKQENEFEGILVSLKSFKELVEMTEMLFNLVNDRMNLGTGSNEFLNKIQALKKQINEAEN